MPKLVVWQLIWAHRGDGLFMPTCQQCTETGINGKNTLDEMRRLRIWHESDHRGLRPGARPQISRSDNE